MQILHRTKLENKYRNQNKSFRDVYHISIRIMAQAKIISFFFLNDPAPTEIYPFPLHAALPISFAPGFSGEFPAIPAAPSSRPASPIEVYGTAETSAAPPPPPVAAQSAPAQTSPRRVVDDREEWEKAEEEAAALPPPPPRPKVSTGWLPLGLAAAGGLLI